MAIVYVASSKGLANWGADHGLTKHCYKIGVTDGTAEAAIEELNASEHAGHTDWKLSNQAETDEDEAAILARRPSWSPSLSSGSASWSARAPAEVVQRHRQQQHHATCGVLVERRHVHQAHAVVEAAHQQRTDQRAQHPAAPA